MIRKIKLIVNLGAALLAAPVLAVETFPATNCESGNSPDTPYYNQVVHDGGALHNFGYNPNLSTLMTCPVRWSKEAKSLKVRISDSNGDMWCQARAQDIQLDAGYTISSSITRYSDGSGAQILDFGNRPGANYDLGHVWVECLVPPNSQIRTIILDEPAKNIIGGLILKGRS